MEDVKGDSTNHAKTFPVLFGISSSSYLLLIILALVVSLSLFPFLQGIWGLSYLLIVLISDGLMIYGILRIHRIRNNEALFFQKVGQSSLLLKLSMVIGLMAIFFGVLTNL
jgi:geranylgeranylglycerol-phosphate geranylgeranyltransferase